MAESPKVASLRGGEEIRGLPHNVAGLASTASGEQIPGGMLTADPNADSERGSLGSFGQASGTRRILADRFEVGDELGRGAHGHVYFATDLTTGNAVAIKEVNIATGRNGCRGADLSDVQKEIELLQSLNHPNIVNYLGSLQTSNRLYIILEFMQNGSLASIIKQWGALSEELAMVYIKQVLEGLVYLHAQGVVHRDIKGANILTGAEVRMHAGGTHRDACMHVRMHTWSHASAHETRMSCARLGHVMAHAYVVHAGHIQPPGHAHASVVTPVEMMRQHHGLFDANACSLHTFPCVPSSIASSQGCPLDK